MRKFFEFLLRNSFIINLEKPSFLKQEKLEGSISGSNQGLWGYISVQARTKKEMLQIKYVLPIPHFVSNRLP